MFNYQLLANMDTTVINIESCRLSNQLPAAFGSIWARQLPSRRMYILYRIDIFSVYLGILDLVFRYAAQLAAVAKKILFGARGFVSNFFVCNLVIRPSQRNKAPNPSAKVGKDVAEGFSGRFFTW